MYLHHIYSCFHFLCSTVLVPGDWKIGSMDKIHHNPRGADKYTCGVVKKYLLLKIF